MGTRSHTYIIEKVTDTDQATNEPITREHTYSKVYKQFDGYPDGYGVELANFLLSRKLVNGIGTDRNVFNGVGCLAAAHVAHFKTEAGGIYMCPTEHNDEGVSYAYYVTITWNFPDKFSINMVVKGGYTGEVEFDGTPEEFLNSKLVKGE